MAAMVCRTLVAWAVLLAGCATTHAAIICRDGGGRTGFSVVKDQDADGNDITNVGATRIRIINDGYKMEPDASSVEQACNKNPWCMAFNNQGWLKHTYGPLRSTPSADICTHKRIDQSVLAPSYRNLVHIGTATARRHCLELNNNNKVSGEPVQQWECVGVPAQEWKMAYVVNDTNGNMYYQIKATDRLCVQAGGESNGATLKLATCSSASRRQHFTFVSSSATFTQDGATKRVYGHVIRLRRNSDGLRSSYCMDVTAASTSNGAKLQVYQCNGSVAQLFRLAKAFSTLGYY